MEFLQPVFQRRAGQHDGVFGGQALDAARGAGFPVLDALGFVQHDQIGRPAADRLGVAVDHVVVGDLEEGLGLVGGLARGQRTLDDQRRAAGEPGDLFAPLMLERGGADDQRALDPRRARQDLGCGDGLDRLAQAHVVGEQAAPGARREERPPGADRGRATS